jgi:hypothetical protein
MLYPQVQGKKKVLSLYHVGDGVAGKRGPRPEVEGLEEAGGAEGRGADDKVTFGIQGTAGAEGFAVEAGTLDIGAAPAMAPEYGVFYLAAAIEPRVAQGGVFHHQFGDDFS